MAIGETGFAQIRTSARGNEVVHVIPVQRLATGVVNIVDRIGGIASARMYADAETTVSAGFFRAGITGSESVEVNMTGYLVNVSQARITLRAQEPLN